MEVGEPTIIYEDESLLVVNKPAGMIVYPDGKHDYPALSHWLEKKYGAGKFHFVHRIDRETSGLLIVALTEEAYAFLKEQFQEREVKKTYRAFVYGTLKIDRGVIDKPIGSSRGGKGPRSAKLPHGTMREAVTAYRVIARGKSGPDDLIGASYVEAFPKTGRTHQIRVHFSAVQHPIVADVLYASRREPILGFKRLALHAFTVSFTHPPSKETGQAGKEVTFTAPLPADFLAAEKLLGVK